VDKAIIRRKISLISEDLIALKDIAKLTLKNYLKDSINEILSERYLERIIGRTIDINYHIITESGFPPPRDYYSSFIKLGEMKIVPAVLAEKLASLAGIRNRLAHEYNDIDEKLIYEAVKFCFTDFPKYLEYVNTFIKR
ncbi:MAG: HepT-like ribonuclease domain-containing protein, partial [Elusimicrobiota bacterium]